MAVIASPSIPGGDLSAYCVDLARRARAAGRLLATVSGARKNDWLHLSLIHI